MGMETCSTIKLLEKLRQRTEIHSIHVPVSLRLYDHLDNVDVFKAADGPACKK